jgi:penicillin-binding protein 1C
LDYKAPPPFEGNTPDAEVAAANAASTSLPMAIFNPEQGAQIYVPVELDGSEGQVVFSAAHRDPHAEIYWHIDDSYLGKTSVFHEIACHPAPGRHTLTLIDSSGHRLRRNFESLER